ncbi:MAG: hypothetical protein JXP73_18780 [Deltaproteobacteria bacterium]|nr:hypothetical protein [Deltaproteobacteria bacterium]
MSKPKRMPMWKSLVATTFLAAAALTAPGRTLAEPADASDADAPEPESAPVAAPPAEAGAAAAPILRLAPVLAPPPGPARAGAPASPFGPPAPPQRPVLAERRKPQLVEPEGPVTSWEPLRFAVALELRRTWLLDDAAQRLVSGREISGQGASLQVDILRPTDRLALRLDVGWRTHSASSYQYGNGLTSHGTLAEKLVTHAFAVGASLRFHVSRWLAPYARLSGGMGWDRLSVGALGGREYFGEGSAGAGVFLRSPSLRFWHGAYAPWLGLVGSIEGGYAVGTGSDFALRASPPSSSDTEPIPGNSVSIGRVERSAPYARATVGLAF